MRKFIAIAVLFLASFALAQDPLPGWNLSINGNFMSVTGAATNNGFASVEAVRVSQNFSLRSDQLNLASPAGDQVYLGRVEYRRLLSDFIKPNQFLNTSNYEPFINAGGGVAVSFANNVSQNRPAFVVGGGFDISVGDTGIFTIRPLDISYVRASIFPGGGAAIGNHMQLLSGLGIRIGGVQTMLRNKAAKMKLKAKYYPPAPVLTQ